MPSTPSTDAWLSRVTQRLESDGFVITRNVRFGDQQFPMAAHRSRFELTKFGNVETFFVFGDVPTATTTSVQAFSSQAFNYAVQSKRVPLPRGLFEAVFCFPVAMTGALDTQTADWLRVTAPPKHWASGEIPVIFDQSTGNICYFEKTPMWGGAYFAGFRTQIKQYLT